MAGSPDWKIYRAGEYVGSAKYREDAAAFVAVCGDQVRCGHSLVVWREGHEEFSAAESYDRAADLMENRRLEYYARGEAKRLAQIAMAGQSA